MNLKSIMVFLIILSFLSMSFVSASWYSDTIYRDGECELFGIHCPYNYKNGGEIQHDSEVYICTQPMKFPNHSIVVREIDDSKIGSIEYDYDVVDVFDDGDFKAYKLKENYVSNTTIVIYSTGTYNYIIKFEHKGCSYDDSRFKEDITTLKNIAHSIYRK